MDMRVDSLPRLQADNGQSGQNRILNDCWAHVLGEFNSVFEPFSTEGFRTNATQIPRGTQVLQLLICKLRVFSPLRPLSGGRRSAAARAGASDGTGFAPNIKPNPVWHSPRSHSHSATLLRTPLFLVPPVRLFLSAIAASEQQ